MATFHSFARLPAELRLAIWKLAVPSEDTQEIYFASRYDFNIDLDGIGWDYEEDDFELDDDWDEDMSAWEDSDDEVSTDAEEEHVAHDQHVFQATAEAAEDQAEDMSSHGGDDAEEHDGTANTGDGSEGEWEDLMLKDPKVVLPFPPMMHVNREARDVVLETFAFQEDRLRSGAVVQVPVRSYNPAVDIFYINAWELPFVLEALGASKDEWYTEIRHVGLQSFCLARGGEEIFTWMCGMMRDLRQVSVIFGPSWRDGSDSDYGHDEDPNRYDPLRHFHLVPWGKKSGCLVHKDLSTRQNIKQTFDAIIMSLSLMEVVDDTSPWDPETGDWLFDLKAMKLARVPQYGLGIKA